MTRRWMIPVCCVLAAAATTFAAAPAEPQDAPTAVTLPDIQTPAGASSALKWLVTITILSVAPAIVMMMTSFTRIIVVLGLLRQALGTNQLPPNQVLFGLAVLMTVVIMAPVYNDLHTDAIAPYLDGKVTAEVAVEAGQKHLRAFMIRQISGAGNDADVRLFLDKDTAARDDLTWGDVPTVALLPGFVLSELKTAFWMGFRIFLPFVIIDMLIASTLVSVGMFMVPPPLISLPMKLLLFVLADGWHLVVGQLIQSFT